MIRDIYSRDIEAPKYSSTTLEVSDPLSQMILKIENCLFTRKGDVLGSPGLGANLEDLIFSLIPNETVIQNQINSQISAYCLANEGGFSIDTNVTFYSTAETDGCLVDIFVNEQRVIGALF
jgi:hypothetical protein|tara:strand:+ start:793 stop:1155 length:363 start_codon:yes stop_codon:yes gene_type:complete